MKITYGLPRIDDLEAMYTVETSCFDDEEQLSYDELQLNLSNHRKNCIVARAEDGHVIGMAIGTPVAHKNLDNDDYIAADLTGAKDLPYLAILSLAVLPAYQGHGIASQLIRRSLLLAKLMGKQAVVLDCVDKLISFYKKQQFELLGRSNSTFANLKWNSMIHKI